MGFTKVATPIARWRSLNQMPKEVDIDEKRSEFIGASIEVIAGEGLGAATMRRVAQQAGCTTGALTHYFANRHDLLVETLRAVHHAAGARMEQAAATVEDPHERLMAVLFEALPLDETRLREWRVWLAFWSASMDDAALTGENDRRYTQWRRALRELLKPLSSNADLDAETDALVAMVDGLGVGVARLFGPSSALRKAQDSCASSIERYAKGLQRD